MAFDDKCKKKKKMVRKSDMLRNVDFTKSNWNIHVRVMRMWEPLYGKQKSASTLELAVSDREGTTMWCTVPKFMMKTVKKKIQENGIYFIKDFFVTRNVVIAKQTKVSTHKYKISFQHNTRIDDATDDDFPPISFHIRTFHDIMSRNQINEIDLIDVIGLLVSKREIEELTIEGKTHRTLSIILQDLEKNVIECTLWDNYIDYLFNNVNFESMGRVIILLQFCQAITFRGQTIISNTRHSKTKMWINSNIPIINEFKNSLIGDDEDSSSQLITTVSSTHSVSLIDDLKSSQVFTIEDLLDAEEGKNLWISATVMGIVPSDKWFYLECKKCLKGVRKERNKFFCRFCNVSQTKANERYVLEVNAKDSTAPITLTLWDRECFLVYGKTANEMRGAKDGNIELFPADLELIEGRSFLFKVRVKPSTKIEGETVFHVMKLTEDKDIISKFGGQTNNCLHSDALISVEDETPHSKESIGETIHIKDCTPAKRLFSSSASVGDGDGDVDIASATKIPRVKN
ncbi:hypothetical protein ACFE04_001864 [Oxalis oulophora]